MRSALGCKDALGLKAAPERHVSFDASALVRSAYEAAKADGGGSGSEAFARAVAEGVMSSSTGASNDRMAANVAHSGRGDYVRYAHVPTSSKVCGFCCMVASRGFDYRNPKRPSLHAGCRCLIVPGLRGRTVLGGYDADAYEKGYGLLVEKDAHGNTVRDGNGVPVFKSGRVFDVDSGSVLKKADVTGSSRIRDLFNRMMGKCDVSIPMGDPIDSSREPAMLDETSGGLFGRLAAPETPFESAMRSNPTGDVENCFACVFAWELRNRGLNAVAKRSVDIPVGFSERGGHGPNYLDCVPDAAIEGVYIDDSGQAMTLLDNATRPHGPGARFYLSVFQNEFEKNGIKLNVSHAMSIYRDNNNSMVIIDPQSGGIADDRVLANSSKHPCAIMRLDNVGFSEAVYDCCEKGDLL